MKKKRRTRFFFTNNKTLYREKPSGKIEVWSTILNKWRESLGYDSVTLRQVAEITSRKIAMDFIKLYALCLNK